MHNEKSHVYQPAEAILIATVVCAEILTQLLFRQYGYLRDELYYIAIGDGWNFTNLDMPPLSPLYLRLFTSVLGHSVGVVHFASSLCSACTMALGCLITREFGGKIYALLLTGVFLLLSGFKIFGSIFTYDSAGNFLSVAALYFVVRALKEDNPRFWIPAGLLLGTGILNKLTVLFLGFGIALSLLLVSQRSLFRSRWIWIAGACAMPFAIPFLVWQTEHGWYFLDFAAQYTGEASYRASFPAFFWNQVLPNNFLLFPVWFAGLLLLLFSPRWKIYRLFGICYVILYLLFFVLHTPFYFLMPLYAVLISAGSTWIEQRLVKPGRAPATVTIGRAAIPLVYIAGSLPLLPLAFPILPVEQLVTYVAKLGVNAGIKTNNSTEGVLPQHFADRFGWDDMVREIAAVYHRRAPGETGGVGILTGNWGEAGAVHIHRAKYGLPEPISTEGWFYFHTLQTHTFRPAYVSIGVSLNRLKEAFSTVAMDGVFRNPYCMPYEDGLPVYFCSDPKCDLRRRWLIEHHMDQDFRKYMDTAGVERAIDYYQALKRQDPSTLLFTERQLNSLGYEYLHRGMIDAAIALFTLNVAEYPESSNVYDSLGEAYFRKGEYDLAAKFYGESLRRDPANANAREYLKKLAGPAGVGH